MKITIISAFVTLFLSANISAQFVENKGQVLDKEENLRPEVKYYYEIQNSAIYFLDNKLVYTFTEIESINEKLYENDKKGLDSIKKLRGATTHRLDMEFIGANSNIEIEKGTKLDGDIHFYLNKRNGIRDVGSYESIKYKNIYNNVDLVFYHLPTGIKYDFILHKGANIADIKIKYLGAKDIILENGKIIIKTDFKNLEEEIPLSFINGNKSEIVDVKYGLDQDGLISFISSHEEYNTLTIDPVLEWATYFNGTAATTAALDYSSNHLDANGNFFIYGQVYSAAGNYPVTNPGVPAYIANYNSNADLYIAKFDQNRTLLWSTYLGGSDGDNIYGSEVITSIGNELHIVGEAISTGAPFTNGGGFYNTTINKPFWARFNITNGALLHLTSISGGYAPSIAISNSGLVAIIQEAYNFNAPIVVARAGAFNQATNGGSKDVFLSMFNASYNQIWGTYLGGPSPQENYMCLFDNADNLFFIGETSWFGSSTPVNERLVNLAGAYYLATPQGGTDVMLGKFNASGVLVWNTLFGGNNSDARRGQQGGYAKILLHPTTNELVMLFNTTSSNLTTINPGGGAYFKTVPTHASFAGASGSFWNYAAYFARFNTSGALNYATYYYNSTDGDLIFDATFGGCNKFYIAGRCDHITATTIPLSGGFNLAAGQQTYIMQFNTTNFVAEWSSFLASNLSYIPAAAGRTDNPRVYFSANGYYDNGPTVNPGGGAYYQANNINGTSANYMIWQIHPTLPPDITGVTTICSGQTTTLTASNGAGAPYEWYTTSSGGAPFFTGAVYTTPALSSNTTYYVSSGTGICASPRAAVTITVNAGPAAPTISSNSPVCVGGNINLTANTIGSASYFWTGPNTFSSSDEDPIITGATAAMGGVYSCYVQVAGCNSTASTTTVTVNTNSVAPTSITGTSTICSGGSTTLTLSGGTAGTGASAQWYSGSCGGTAVGTGNSISVSPSSNTTYFVRYEGTCNTTICASVAVTVNTLSVAPTSITGTSTICSGSSTTLTLSGGTAGTGATANWYTGPNGTGTFVGTGSSVTVSPTSTTTYFVRYEGTCNTTADASLTVTVNTLSVAPTSITGTSTICSSASTTLTLSGGTAGTGATAQWYSGSCGGTLVGTGNSIVVSPTVTTTYFVRYSGICNTTTCASVTVTVNNAPATPGIISGTTPICNGTSNTYSITAVGGATSYTWAYTGGGAPTGTGVSTTFSPTSSGTLTVTATNSCGTSAAQTLAITVNTAENASFTLSSNTQCQNGTNITATITGISGGTFTATPGGLSLNAATGAINVAASTPNTYTVTYTTPGSCPGTANTSVTINATQNSAFTLSSGTVCQNGSNVTANITGVPGGAFSSTAGLSLNTTTGAINVLASTPNTYNVTYTSPGPCASSTVQSITINAPDNAAFSYSGGTFCTSGTNPTPTITGLAGGTFTATPAGLSINASTGAINLAASTVNTYTVTYTTNGTCPNTATANINITNAPSAVFSYTGTPYCSNAGTANVTFGSGAGGGVFSATPAGLSINTSTGAVNLSASTPNTYTVTNFIAAASGCAAATETTTITINAAESANFSLSSAAQCQNGTDISATITGTIGGTFTAIPAGLSINASTGAIDVSASTGGTYTVTYTTPGTCSDAQNTTVTITTADNASFTLSSASVCQNGTDVTASISGTVGGTFSSTPVGLSLNTANGAIDVSASTPGTYDVTYTTAGTCPSASTVVITVSATDDASFTYTGTTFCASGTNPTPIITGLAGGTFTATPAGLSLNASTGEITLATSTINNYVVTYTTNGSCPTTSTATINVTNSPSATFTYSSNSICGGSGTASVSFPIGASGGVFSATPAGLSINASTGEIDLSASSPNTYTVTNFIAASGGCATATDNFVVTILPADDASFTFPAVSACQSLATFTPTISGTSGGSFTSSPAGLLINGSTGVIDLENSSIGNYSITYTTSGTCPDTENVSLEVLSSPIAPTVSVDNSVVCAGDPVIISATGSGGGVSYSVFSALTGGTALGTTPLTVNPTTTTNYYVEAFGTNGCGNIGGRQLIVVTVNPLPTVTAGADQTICPTESATLTATGTGSFVWSTTETTTSITVTPAITTTYTVTITDANSCSNSANVVVTVQSIGGSLTANDDAFTATSGGTSTFDVLNNDINGGTPNIISGPTNGTATVNTSNQIVYTSNPNYVGTEIITYTICDAFCVNICDTAVVTITVSREIVIEVPGGFTPNGDNINDIFVIQGLDQYPNNELTIYNRWGSIVYSAKPYNNDWNGKSTGSGVIMGDNVTTGTYFYVLKLSEDQEPLKGSLEIKFN